MKPAARGIAIASLLVFCLGFAGGCASSTPSRFYTLTSLQGSGGKAGGGPADPGAIVSVGPVEIPDYLYRPQIVTRTDGNEVRIDETERWAGSLKEDVTRVLVENLSVLLAGDRIVVLRWEQAMLFSVPVRVRIGVELVRFEGTLGGDVVLRARYTIYDVDGKALSVRETTFEEPASGPDYGALSAAMSRTLASVSREIATAVRAK